MSRIGNRIIAITENVTVEVKDSAVVVTGPKGTLTTDIAKNTEVEVSDNTVIVKRTNESIPTKQMHGTTNANITNMIKGVSEGYAKSLEIIGVGYRFNVKGNTIVVNAGYSHPVEITIPEGLSVAQKSMHTEGPGIWREN